MNNADVFSTKGLQLLSREIRGSSETYQGFLSDKNSNRVQPLLVCPYNVKGMFMMPILYVRETTETKWKLESKHQE